MRQCRVVGIVANWKSHNPSIGLALAQGRNHLVVLILGKKKRWVSRLFKC